MSEKDPLDEILAGGLGEWFKGRKLEDLEIQEIGGEPLFPDTITRIHFEEKKLYEVPVYMRIPPPRERALARVSALFWLANQAKRDPKSFVWADALAIFGEKYAQEAEQIEILALALRRRNDPSQQYMTPELLQKSHPAPALWDAFSRMEAWRSMTDLRINELELDERRVWAIVAAVAKADNVGPLVVTDGPGMLTFIVTMAKLLHAYRTTPPSQPSAESSTSTD